MKKIAIFASGSGSNAENIIRYFSDDDSVRVAVVLSNNATAGVHVRAAKLGVPSFSYSKEAFVEASAIIAKLREYKVELVVLAGFMNKISEPLLDAFPGRIINIHPALLPKHGGKGMYGMHVHRAVLAAGDRQSGITIHYINEYYDEGAIIVQVPCPVFPTDSPETLAARVHELEYWAYPRAIEKILEPDHFIPLVQ